MLRRSFLVLLTLLLLPSAAMADIRHEVAGLTPLALHYGVNNLKVDGRDVLIIKGDFNTGNASGGDAYSLLVHGDAGDGGGEWKMVRFASASWNRMMLVTEPRTGEDSVMTARFLVPGTLADKAYAALYLLTAERAGRTETRQQKIPAQFTLYRLSRDDDFGIYSLQQVATEKARQPTCNVDWALWRELKVPLPEADAAIYDCGMR